MWDLNFRGLGLALQLLLLAPLCQPSVGKTTATATTDDLPHPWLTENRTATVLELVCRPPANIKRDKIYGLELRFSRLAYRNMTLALMTTAMEIPRHEEVPDIANVSFNGNWDSPSLSVRMPFTSGDFGEYSCSGQYKEQGRTGGTAPLDFNTKITVNGSQSQSHYKQNFEVRVIDVHEVRVTWRAPKGSKFIQASISRTSLVKETGMELSASKSLFTTSVEGSFVYNSKVTLLAKFQSPSQDGGNFSMRLYVDSSFCHPYCRYSCHVPYTGCYGQKVKFCDCSQEGVSHNQDSVPESSQSTDLESTTERQGQDPVPESTEFTPAFIAMLALFIVSVVVWVIFGVLCYLFGRQKCQNCKCLVRFAACLAKYAACLDKYVKPAEQMNRSPSGGGNDSEVLLNDPNLLGNSSSDDRYQPGTQSGTGDTSPSAAQNTTINQNKVNKAHLDKYVIPAEQMNRSPSGGGNDSEVQLNGLNLLGNSSSDDYSQPGTSGTGNTLLSVARYTTISLNEICPGSGLPSGTDNEKDPKLTPGHSQSNVEVLLRTAHLTTPTTPLLKVSVLRYQNELT